MRTLVARGASGGYLRYLTPASALGRFLTAPLRLGRHFDGDGEPVYAPEAERLRAKATARLQAAARQRAAGLGVAYGLSLAASMAVMLIEKSIHQS